MINNPHSTPTQEVQSSQTNSRRTFAAKWMHAVGTAEGTSFLLLLLIAMPFKYIGGNPSLVQLLGPIHGGLFLLYIASAIAVARILNWRPVYVLLAVVASVVPFGPFIFEAWLHRQSKEIA